MPFKKVCDHLKRLNDCYDVSFYKETYYKDTEKVDMLPLNKGEVIVIMFPTEEDNSNKTQIGMSMICVSDRSNDIHVDYYDLFETILGLWESIHNEKFKGGEFDTFKNEAGSNTFKMSPQKWIRETDAIGIISKSGRYDGGTFADSDIAFEFASWLSPEFKLYVIQEFQRLKKNEAYQNKIDWYANRVLATDAIKSIIVPTLTKKFVYAEEADVLNVALFGMTAKEWR